MTPFAASVALLRRHDVLLIQRNRPPSEGLWTLPGGRLEPGETAEQCAVREVKEELGLSVFALRPVTVLQVRRFRLQVFATQALEGEIVPDAAEVRDWRWVKPGQLGGLRTTPDLGDVLERAFRMFDRT
ncbi:MAG: NUDIX domain-containing protein [Devosia nanyangense]|uniref:NUDIX domain-containing protein n=1 Tax=Devosia nanyangense TaxID=1228055 RepID=A0A933NZV4_9HYPH|nr:NUDIX domain-containing protein [Devosia nanyangense]